LTADGEVRSIEVELQDSAKSATPMMSEVLSRIGGTTAVAKAETSAKMARFDLCSR